MPGACPLSYPGRPTVHGWLLPNHARSLVPDVYRPPCTVRYMYIVHHILPDSPSTGGPVCIWVMVYVYIHDWVRMVAATLLPVDPAVA